MLNYPFWVNDFDRVKDHRITHPSVAKIFEHPVAFWYGTKENKRVSNNNKLEKSLKRFLKRTSPNLPYFVIYNMPNRDLGHYSKGGAQTAVNYMLFLEEFCRGIEGTEPIIIFEPDALPHTTLMDNKQAEHRKNLIREGLEVLTTGSKAKVYVDIGHSNWLTPTEAHELLESVYNDNIRGFSVNVSNYRSNAECMEWGDKICDTSLPNFSFIKSEKSTASDSSQNVLIILNIVSFGNQNVILNGNPKKTFFKSTYACIIILPLTFWTAFCLKSCF